MKIRAFLSLMILLCSACGDGGAGDGNDSGAGGGAGTSGAGAGGTGGGGGAPELDRDGVAELVNNIGGLDDIGAGMGSGGGSADDCPTLVGCLGECAESDSACIDACAAAASSDAIDALNALVDCATTSSCEDEACLQDSCAAEIGVCAGVPVEQGTDTDDCLTLVDCTSLCDEGDEACLQDCADVASSEAIAAYDALVTCVNAAGCTDETCIEQSCGDELLECANVSGTGGTGGTGGAGGTGGTGGAGGTGGGVTSSGSCDVSSPIPDMPPWVQCWDYELTATETSNNGVENYYYYDAGSAADGQALCEEEDGLMFGGEVTPGATPEQIATHNETNKENACTGLTIGGSTVTWTAGGSCAPAGAVGHCTRTVTNTIMANGAISSTVETVWE